MATTLPAILRPHSQALETYDAETGIRSRLRSALLAVGLLVVVIGSAAALIPIGGAVIGGGQLGVESRVKRIAHPTGGVVSEVLVRNGQHVRRGQVLMRLDDTVTDADAQLSTLSVDQLLAQRARLEAERLGTGAIAWPKALTSRTDAGARKAMADEQKLFVIRRSESAGLTAQLDARIRQYAEQNAGYEAQIRALEKQSVLIEPERRGVKELWDKNLVTINRLNELERTAVDMQGSIGALRASIAQTQARVTEARQQIIQMSETRRSEAGTQLSQINAALNQQQVRSVSAGDLQERSLIRAPYDGIVDKLQYNTVGDVIRPAEPIMEIVPDQDRLLVEAAISPSDIDQVQTGQSTRIRFTAFNSTASPEIAGKVVFVAAERTTEQETQRSYYPVRIEIDQQQLAKQRDMALKPGMPAEIFIETGSRSMMSYLTKPLRDQMARAFRDN